MNGRFLPNLGANAFASKAPSRALPKTGWDKGLNLFLFPMRPKQISISRYI